MVETCAARISWYVGCVWEMRGTTGDIWSSNESVCMQLASVLIY